MRRSPSYQIKESVYYHGWLGPAPSLTLTRPLGVALRVHSCVLITNTAFIVFADENFVAKTDLQLGPLPGPKNQDTQLRRRGNGLSLSCCRSGVELTYYGISLNIAGFGPNLYLTQFLFASMEFLLKICAYFFLEQIGRRASVTGALFLTGLCLLINIFLSKGSVFTAIVCKPPGQLVPARLMFEFVFLR